MTLADDAGVPDLSIVTSISYAFQGATSFNGNLSSWDVSNVTNMRNIFSGATSFNSDISSWDVSRITSISYAFSNASNFNSDLGSWNVSSVNYMTNTFTGATSFSSENYDALLTGWSSRTLVDGVTFAAPPTTYCSGKAGRNILIGTYNWTITGDLGEDCPAPFVTTWEVTTGDLSITIPTNSFGLTYSYTVDWGDGTTDTTTYTGDATHTYPAAGTYTVAISGTFPAIYFSNFSPQAGDNSLKIKTIKSWGTQRWGALQNAFQGCQNLTTIEDGAGVPDLTMVTDMGRAFDGATNFNQDISTWNVSKVSDMWSTFSGATRFNQDLSSWDVSNVTDMVSTFSGATSFNGDLSSWDVSNVTSMSQMFSGATSFNGDLSSWNVSNVHSVNQMFSGATSFNQDLSSWNVSKVDSTNGFGAGRMSHMFSGATNFNQDISSWNVSNVASMDNMFFGATSFNQDLSSWNVSKVGRMNSMFEGATSFNQDLSSWNVSKVGRMNSMFEGATSFDQDINSWNVSKVTDMAKMFTDATSFSSENYDALLTGWSSLPTLQDDVLFGAPPTTYCSGKAGRDILINTYNWNITGDMGEDCTAVTSVDEEFLSNTKIYPNPSNGKISIESSFEIDKLELYNVLGAKLFSVSKTNVLDLTSLSQGIYILKVFSGDRVFAKKLVKD